MRQLDIAQICVLNHPKNVSHYIKYLEKTLKICEFFQKICISDFAKMGWKRGQLCLGCLEGFCFCFDVWIQCCHNNHSSFILQKSHQEQMSEHSLNLWWHWINPKGCKILKTFCRFRSMTVLQYRGQMCHYQSTPLQDINTSLTKRHP